MIHAEPFQQRSGGRMNCRIGTTAVELVVAILVIGIVASIGISASTSQAASHAVRTVANETERAFATARRNAIATGTPTALSINSAVGQILVHAEGDTLARLTPALTHGVAISANRDSMAYDQQGLGIGAANLTLVLNRAGAAETLVVSRLGRVRR